MLFLIPVIEFIIFPSGVLLKEFWLGSLINESIRKDDPYNKVIKFIRNNSKPGETIFVAGQSYATFRAYVFSQRLPSTLIAHPDFYTYRKISDVVNDLEKRPPRIICVPSPSLGGLTGENAIQFDNYLRGKYASVYEASWNDKYCFFMAKSQAFDKRKDWIKVYLREHSVISHE
jgi:hypothetical protein